MTGIGRKENGGCRASMVKKLPFEAPQRLTAPAPKPPFSLASAPRRGDALRWTIGTTDRTVMCILRDQKRFVRMLCRRPRRPPSSAVAARPFQPRCSTRCRPVKPAEPWPWRDGTRRSYHTHLAVYPGEDGDWPMFI